MRITVTLPMPPNLANARMHWRKKTQAHAAWKQRAIVGEPQLRGRRPRRPYERVVVTAVLYPRQLMDDDNAVARLKWCLDLLKDRGLIVDDKRPHLVLGGIPEQRVGGKPTRIELTIESAA